VDAWVFGGNWPEIDHGEGGPKAEDFAKELHADTPTNPDGTFRLNVLSGHLYEVGAGLPPDSDFIPPDFQNVKVTGATAGPITLQLERSLGSMTGTVKIGGGAGVPVNHGFVHCWAEDGGFTGGPVEWGGTYRVNYKAGEWHCGADSFDGTKFYMSEEVLVNITDETSISQDFNLDESIFNVPPAVSTTFDAGNVQNISLDNGTTINIPAGALGESGTDVTVTATPTVDMYRTKNNQPFGVGYELEAQDADNNAITSFNSNVTITFYYTDEQLDSLGLNEGSLLAKYYDESTNTYRNPIGVTQDQDNNSITIQTNHFTKFAVVSGQAGLGGGSGVADIIATPASGGGPQVILANENGETLANFFAYSTNLRIGMETVTADIDGDGISEIITAPGSGAAPQVRVFDRNGNVLSQFFAFPSHLRDGVHVTAGDVNGDGKAEIIVAPKAGAAPQVRVFDGDGNVLTQGFVYNTTFRGGVELAVGDVDGDGIPEIVAAPESNGGPEVVIMDGENANIDNRFDAYASTLRGGFHLTTGDVNGDGSADVVIAPKAGHAPQVAVYEADGTAVLRFFAFADTFRGGVNVSVGDVDNDGSNDIVVSPQSSAGPQIRTFNNDGTVKAQFFSYASTLRGNFTSFVADLNGDGTTEIVTAPGPGMGPQVRTFNQNGTALSQFFTHHTGFRGGINIYPAY
ncbi:FG-GAP repeat domain-containing protein, partial [Patescibacteria group bacterium]